MFLHQCQLGAGLFFLAFGFLFGGGNEKDSGFTELAEAFGGLFDVLVFEDAAGPAVGFGFPVAIAEEEFEGSEALKFGHGEAEGAGTEAGGEDEALEFRWRLGDTLVGEMEAEGGLNGSHVGGFAEDAELGLPDA